MNTTIKKYLEQKNFISDKKILSSPDNIINESMVQYKENEEAAKIVKEARTFVALKYPWIGRALLELPCVEDNRKFNDTWYTNGKVIAYNSNFVLRHGNDRQKNKREAIWVLIHEIMHCLLGHFTRMQGPKYNRELANIAQDYAINYMITNNLPDMKDSMPNIALYDEKYAGMSAEEIYDLLEKDINAQKLKQFDQVLKPNEGQQGDGQPGDGQTSKGEGKGKEKGEGEGSGSADGEGDGKGSGEGDGKEFGEGSTLEVGGEKETEQKEGQGGGGMSDKELSEHWKGIANSAKGKMPAGFQRAISDTYDTKMDWRQQLKRFLSQISNRMSYRGFSKRHIHSGTYVPGLKRNDGDMGIMVVAFDTSGSVGDEELNAYATELINMKRQVNPEKIYVIYADASVANVQEFNKNITEQELRRQLEPKGGGGTDFRPVFEWIEKNLIKRGKKVNVLAYFTDGYGDFPTKPKYHMETIWLIYKSEVVPPFGNTIRLDDFIKSIKN